MAPHLFIIAVCLVSAWATPHCNGTASMYGAYDDKQLVQLLVKVVDNEFEVTGSTVSSSMSSAKGRLCEKESGVSVNHVANPVQVFAGTNSVELLDVGNRVWRSVEVESCQPEGVAQHGPDIVGYCKLDTTRSPPCVQYFKLYQQNGVWRETSSCSRPLSIYNLTNSVVLRYWSQYGLEIKLYFAEERSNRLHELDLVNQGTMYYDVPDHQGSVMKISRIVPMVASDETFAGLRLELYTDNFPHVVYHKIFSSIEQHFLVNFFWQTETIAFDLYDLRLLVSFSTNLKTMNVMPKNGSEILQYTLPSTLDDPIQCKNMAGPLTHCLICLAGNGLTPILINVLLGTSKAIPIGESPVINFGVLYENLIYLLDTQQVLSLYILDNLTAVHIGDHTIRHGTSLRLFNINSSLSCFDHQSTGSGNSSSSNTIMFVIFLLCIITGIIITAVLVIGILACRAKLKNKKKNFTIKTFVKSSSTNTSSSNSIIPESSETVHMPAEEGNNDEERGTDGIPENQPEEATPNTGGIFARPPFEPIVQLDYPPHRIGIRQPTPNQSGFVEASSTVSAVSCSSRDPSMSVTSD